MESREFRELVGSCLLRSGFSRKGAYFYRVSPDVIHTIHLQRSYYSKGFYISVGYFLRGLDPTVTTPRDVDGHLRTRFDNSMFGTHSDLFELEELTELHHALVESCIRANVAELIDTSSSVSGVMEFLKKQPALLYQTTTSAKEFLGLT